MKRILTGSALMLAAASGLAQPAPAPRGAAPVSTARPHEIVFYEHVDFGGDSEEVANARAIFRTNWNIRSVGVHPGDRWQICARNRFRDPCIILDRSVRDASLIGIEGQIGSVRPAP